MRIHSSAAADVSRRIRLSIPREIRADSSPPPPSLKNTLKAMALALLVGLMTTAPAMAATQSYSFNSGFENGGVIPDGSITGWSDTRQIEDWGSGFTITDVTVSLHISGGFNGDLYGYLAHDTGFAVLLNRVGRTDSEPFGYGDAGFNITLNDSAAGGDIHLYGGNGGNLLTGAFQPDGRNVDPAVVTDASPRTATLATLQGMNPLGQWTIFLADLSGGGESTVESWSLEIVAVPEPGTVALGLMASVAGFVLMRRRRR